MIRKLPKITAVILALVMAVAMVTACSKPDDTGATVDTPAPAEEVTPFTPPAAPDVPAEEEPAEEPAEEMDPELAEFLRDWGEDPPIVREINETRAADPNTPLVSAYGSFSERFSPFFSQSAYDSDVADMTQLGIMIIDRAGAIVYNGIQGETRNFNGEDYFYQGTANLAVNYDADADITTYRARIRKDLKFSDGTPVTIDDLIFTYYVLLDTDYVGSSTLFSYDIVGLKNYRSQLSDEALNTFTPVVEGILAAGVDHAWSASDTWTQAQQDDFWGQIKDAWVDGCGQIVDYVFTNYLSYAPSYFNHTEEEVSAAEGMKVAFGMLMWGFGDVEEDGDGNEIFVGSVTGTEWNLTAEEYPTLEDYYNETFAAYEGDPDAFWDVEDPAGNGGLSLPIVNGMIKTLAEESGMGGEVPNISGIRKLNDYAVEVQVNGFSAPAVYSILGQALVPLHYYGDRAQYDYENNKFGFPRGDLSIVRDKTTKPLGAGSYKFVEYSNKTVYFEANEYYYKGEPLIKYLQFKDAPTAEVASGIVAATHDQGELSGSIPNLNSLKDYNPNGEVTGEVITTSMVDNRGYGYIGINSHNVSVDGERGSEASKNLRKALATVLSVFRDTAINSYYGELANAIQYPISNTSWAAPQPTDEGFEIAFSKDINGNALFTSGMAMEDKVAAAKEAALGFFEAAGFTVENGKVTAGPADVRTVHRGDVSYLEYEVWIPADGVGDHPAYALLTDFQAAMADIGITITIVDLSNSAELWTAMDAELLDMWTAAWSATVDPDMHQVYHSSNAIGEGGSESNKYGVMDDQLDQLIMDARMSEDQSYRKAVYKQAMDIVMDWAVEVPNYQRKNFQIFSTERINIDTLTPMITTNWGWGNDIQKIEMR